MRYCVARLIQGVFAVLAQTLVIVGCGLIMPQGTIVFAAFAQSVGTIDQGGRSFDDDAGNPRKTDPPVSEDGAPSRDDTPQSDIPSEPPYGGCIFDRKPLQLMV